MENITNISQFNELVFNYWYNLVSRENFALPYLIVPSQAYEKAILKVAVYDPAPYGWGELERNTKANFPANYKEIEYIYYSKINQVWENLGSVWPSYIDLRCLAEGDTPLDEFKDKVGFIQSNVALIAKRYEKEYDPDMIDFLAKSFEKQIKLLTPNVLLLRIGFGTVGHTEKPSLKIIEKTVMGRLIGTIPVPNCPSLFKLEFQNNLRMQIYGCPQCQGFTYRPLVEEFKNILSYLLKK